jgi:hypothetical protein
MLIEIPPMHSTYVFAFNYAFDPDHAYRNSAHVLHSVFTFDSVMED